MSSCKEMLIIQAKFNTTTIFVQDIFVLLMEYDSEIDYGWVCIRNHPPLLTGQDNLYQKYPPSVLF